MSGIYERVIKLANEKNVSIRELERNIEISNSVIRRWKVASPTIDNVSKVADYFGVSVDYLISGRDSISLSKQEKNLILELRKLEKRINVDSKNELIGTLQQIIKKAQM